MQHKLIFSFATGTLCALSLITALAQNNHPPRAPGSVPAGGAAVAGASVAGVASFLDVISDPYINGINTRAREPHVTLPLPVGSYVGLPISLLLTDRNTTVDDLDDYFGRADVVGLTFPYLQHFNNPAVDVIAMVTEQGPIHFCAGQTSPKGMVFYSAHYYPCERYGHTLSSNQHITCDPKTSCTLYDELANTQHVFGYSPYRDGVDNYVRTEVTIFGGPTAGSGPLAKADKWDRQRAESICNITRTGTDRWRHLEINCRGGRAGENGSRIQFVYSGPRVQSIVDHSTANTWQLEYDASNRVKKLTTPAGDIVVTYGNTVSGQGDGTPGVYYVQFPDKTAVQYVRTGPTGYPDSISIRSVLLATLSTGTAHPVVAQESGRDREFWKDKIDMCGEKGASQNVKLSQARGLNSSFDFEPLAFEDGIVHSLVVSSETSGGIRMAYEHYLSGENKGLLERVKDVTSADANNHSWVTYTYDQRRFKSAEATGPDAGKGRAVRLISRVDDWHQGVIPSVEYDGPSGRTYSCEFDSLYRSTLCRNGPAGGQYTQTVQTSYNEHPTGTSVVTMVNGTPSSYASVYDLRGQFVQEFDLMAGQPSLNLNRDTYGRVEIAENQVGGYRTAVVGGRDRYGQPLGTEGTMSLTHTYGYNSLGQLNAASNALASINTSYTPFGFPESSTYRSGKITHTNTVIRERDSSVVQSYALNGFDVQGMSNPSAGGTRLTTSCVAASASLKGKNKLVSKNRKGKKAVKDTEMCEVEPSAATFISKRG